MNESAHPTHAPLSQFARVNHELMIGGVPLTQLAARVGSTPFYAYDRQLLSDRVAQLRAQLPGEIHLHYAMKANPMPAVVGHMAPLVDGIDVASHNEMLVALDSGMAPQRISFAGPGKTTAEIRCAVAAGIVLNLESERELAEVIAAGKALRTTPRVAIRVNPDFECKGSGMRMSGGAKPFGIDAERVPAMLKVIEDATLNFEGFHIFTGSQNLRAEAVIEAQKNVLALAYKLAAATAMPTRMLNIGGGFGIPYFPGDTPLDSAAIGAHLAQTMPEIKQNLPHATVVVELGRYFVGEAGVYVSRVTDRKISRGQTFLVVDGGMHHHLAASGNFGQVIRKNYPVAVGTRMDAAETEIVSVVGPLCTPLDLLADKVALAHADIGDLIVVFQSGAYGPTASPQHFLSHPHVREVLV